MRRHLWVLIALIAAATSGFVRGKARSSSWPPAPGHITLKLWPHGAPDAQPAAGPEKDTTTAKDASIAGRPIIRLGNVATPTITLYKPNGKNTGAAIVVFPGGSYNILAIDLEGTEVCDWLNSIGVTCVLLKYRVPNTGPYPKSPVALEDAQRAMGMVRERSAEWGIDPHRVGVLGFSAGGHLAAAISTHYDRRLYPAVDAADRGSCRPDFAVVIYPGYLALADKNFELNPDIPVTGNTPPTFLLQAEDDPVHVENSIVYFMALKNAKVPAELHVYTHGGHGYGLRRTDLPITRWPELVDVWLHTIRILPGSAS
jgi:acetyl esterase/lipase